LTRLAARARVTLTRDGGAVRTFTDAADPERPITVVVVCGEAARRLWPALIAEQEVRRVDRDRADRHAALLARHPVVDE
jgi:hypothetical protein